VTITPRNVLILAEHAEDRADIQRQQRLPAAVEAANRLIALHEGIVAEDGCYLSLAAAGR
jgi:hypothetical protein